MKNEGGKDQDWTIDHLVMEALNHVCMPKTNHFKNLKSWVEAHELFYISNNLHSDDVF